MSETDPFAGQWTDIKSVLADAGPATTTELAGIPSLTKVQKVIAGVVASGTVAIATIGFAGSYQAVVKLAAEKGFGRFAQYFPLGVDIGITNFLALDLLLTWLRMPYPLLRHAAWALTAATIAFNVAASWGDEVAVGMHAAIPMLFVIAVEAARHAIGRIAQITADTHYENPPLIRWILSPYPTYRIWRRMRLWNLRSYTTVIELERETKEFRAELRNRGSKFGIGWRAKANPSELLALRLARFGKPVRETVARAEAELVRLEVPEPPAAVPAELANPTRLELDPAPTSRPEPGADALNLEPQVPRTSPQPMQVPNPTAAKANREPRTSRTANQVGDRAAKRTAQIDEVLNLMKELGYDAVNLAEVQNRVGLSKTTAYHRLTDARAAWKKKAA